MSHLSVGRKISQNRAKIKATCAPSFGFGPENRQRRSVFHLLKGKAGSDIGNRRHAGQMIHQETLIGLEIGNDNAQLAVVYTEAYQLTGETRYARVVDQVLTYVSREMSGESGGFYSATDADSANDRGETEEGYFFTWTSSELRDVLA